MASKKWILVPGNRSKRWKKSRNDWRPGCGTTRFTKQVPPHWYRNELNRRERRRLYRALHRGQADHCFYVHPRTASWYW
jgi:hypothetical protein